MNNSLKKYFSKIEHLPYEKRKPEHATLFENKAILSKLTWDIHSHNACMFYKKQNPKKYNSILSKDGLVSNKLSTKDTNLLKEIFLSCKEIEFDPFNFDSDYFYEPRKNVHEDMVRINHYYQPSEFLFKNLPKIINPLQKIIEQECGFYFKIISLRAFQVKSVESTQGFHLDDQPCAIKKIFFYPNGVGKELGSTQIKKKNGETVIIEGNAGTWVIFENSLVEHQAFSSPNSKRPTIEVDIVPSFETNMSLKDFGINSWHPWFPFVYSDKSDLDVRLNTEELNFENVHKRTLQRVAGLCTINKTNNYKFPVDFKDVEIGDDFLDKKAENLCNSTDIGNISKIRFKDAFKNLLDEYGYQKILLRSIKIMPKILIKKIKKIIFNKNINSVLVK